MEMPLFKLKNFDGPFDLLLHLIKKHEMNINDIQIHEITKQYLEYITMMQELDLEVTSEFIVIAATLIEIKSKSLLPKSINKEDVDEKDLTRELMEKLIEYKKFKRIAEYLRGQELSTGEVFTKKAEIIEEPKELGFDENYLKNISMLDLYKIYNSLMRIYSDKQNTNVVEKQIRVDKYKVSEKLIEIKQYLSNEPISKFSQFIYMCECKLEVVVTFLALLELVKDEYVKVIQYDNFGEIIVEKVNT